MKREDKLDYKKHVTLLEKNVDDLLERSATEISAKSPDDIRSYVNSVRTSLKELFEKVGAEISGPILELTENKYSDKKPFDFSTYYFEYAANKQERRKQEAWGEIAVFTNDLKTYRSTHKNFLEQYLNTKDEYDAAIQKETRAETWPKRKENLEQSIASLKLELEDKNKTLDSRSEEIKEGTGRITFLKSALKKKQHLHESAKNEYTAAQEKTDSAHKAFTSAEVEHNYSAGVGEGYLETLRQQKKDLAKEQKSYTAQLEAMPKDPMSDLGFAKNMFEHHKEWYADFIIRMKTQNIAIANDDCPTRFVIDTIARNYDDTYRKPGDHNLNSDHLVAALPRIKHRLDAQLKLNEIEIKKTSEDLNKPDGAESSARLTAHRATLKLSRLREEKGRLEGKIKHIEEFIPIAKTLLGTAASIEQNKNALLNERAAVKELSIWHPFTSRYGKGGPKVMRRALEAIAAIPLYIHHRIHNFSKIKARKEKCAELSNEIENQQTLIKKMMLGNAAPIISISSTPEVFNAFATARTTLKAARTALNEFEQITDSLKGISGRMSGCELSMKILDQKKTDRDKAQKAHKAANTAFKEAHEKHESTSSEYDDAQREVTAATQARDEALKSFDVEEKSASDCNGELSDEEIKLKTILNEPHELEHHKAKRITSEKSLFDIEKNILERRSGLTHDKWGEALWSVMPNANMPLLRAMSAINNSDRYEFESLARRSPFLLDTTKSQPLDQKTKDDLSECKARLEQTKKAVLRLARHADGLDIVNKRLEGDGLNIKLFLGFCDQYQNLITPMVDYYVGGNQLRPTRHDDLKDKSSKNPKAARKKRNRRTLEISEQEETPVTNNSTLPTLYSQLFSPPENTSTDNNRNAPSKDTARNTFDSDTSDTDSDISMSGSRSSFST